MVAVKRHKLNPIQTARRARAKLRPIQPEYITKAEGVALLDRQARKYLNMSGEEFRDKFKSGELRYSDSPHVARVSFLIAFAEE